MKTNWIYKLVRYLKKIYFKNDKRVAAFVVCVAIATGFWFLNALSKTYTVDMNVPVRYINLPDNKTLANQLPDKFDLRIKAHGFTILRNQVSFLFMPLEFDANDLTDNQMMDKRRNTFAIPSRQFLSKLSYQLSNELEILSMNPDTLYFRYDHTSQKRVKVKPVVMVNLKKQFQVSGKMETKPDSVIINGPQSLLDTLHFVSTEPQKFNEVEHPIKTEAPLQKLKDSFFETRKVEINIPVEEYTEAQLSVPILMINKPSDLNIKLFPAKAKVTFQVGLSRFQEIHPEDFKLTVNFSDIREGIQRLKITIGSTPAYLYELKISPEEIEYLIQN